MACTEGQDSCNGGKVENSSILQFQQVEGEGVTKTVLLPLLEYTPPRCVSEASTAKEIWMGMGS